MNLTAVGGADDGDGDDDEDAAEDMSWANWRTGWHGDGARVRAGAGSHKACWYVLMSTFYMHMAQMGN